MSGSIRRQLGPARKRLTDRIEEASLLVRSPDGQDLKSVRSRLLANIASHDVLIEKLDEVTDIDDGEKAIIEKDLENGSSLSLDGKEMIQLLDDVINSVEKQKNERDAKGTRGKSDELMQEKLAMEIENLKLDNEYKLAQIEALNKKENSEVNKSTVKLPRIDLPEFSGKRTDWPSFWDSYKATIHTNSNLSKLDKFKYLMSCLHDEAKDTLTGFNIGEAQYDKAIELLEERYDDKEFIIHTYYEELSKIPKSKNTTWQLRKTFNTIETQLRSLESLGENVENRHIVAIIKSKFPSEINLKLEESREGEWTVNNLRVRIKKLIVAREKSEECGKKTQDDGKFDDSEESSGEFLLSKDAKVKCIFCGMNHWHDECQRYKTLQVRKAQIRGRCFNCLSTQHLFRQCTSEKPCFYCRRKGNHHSSLCPTKFDEEKQTKREENKDDQKDAQMVGDEIMINIGEKVIMKTARVCMKNPKSGEIEQGMAMLDTGAKHTYVTMEKAKSLGLDFGSSRMVQLCTFGNTNPTEVKTCQTSLCIRQIDGSLLRIKARICKNITGQLTKSKIPLDKYNNIWKDLTLADELPEEDKRIKLDILIGNDYYDDIMKQDKLKIGNGLYLISSTLGWMFSGRLPGEDEHEIEPIMFAEEIDVSRAYWDLETIGVINEPDNAEDLRVIDSFKNTIIQDGDRYEVCWPWKSSKYELPSNFSLAGARLRSLMKNFKNAKMKKEYDDIINQQLEDGIVEVADCSTEYKQRDEVVTHYLPHHAVVSETKMRIVYAGNAKSSKSAKCINECLHPGINMIANLVGLLLRFRMKKVALVADIKKAYLQIQLSPHDRDVVRFLWVKDIDKEVTADNIQELRFCRVIWGVISAAFMLAYTIFYHLQKYNTPVSKDISKNMYVDNLISGTNNEEKAIEYYNETKTIFNAAAMNMCKWSCNDERVMTKIKVEDRCDDTILKVLGVIWNRQLDTISMYRLKGGIGEVVTKREILKVISGIYDPLGLFAPVLLKSKLLLQEVWKLGLNWDDVVPETIEKQWKQNLRELEDLHMLTINRCVVSDVDGNITRYELLTFTDASKRAYSAVVYLIEYGVNSINTYLIFSKSRLAPVSSDLSIPRLELLSVLIGCRVSKYVAIQLGITDIKRKVFTDSKCVIEWINSKNDLKRFVNERVKEIRESNVNVRYVSSIENPADIPTRGQTVHKLKNNKLWWKGPDWCSRPYNEWPSFNYVLTNEIQQEVKYEEKSKKVLFETALVATTQPSGPFGINENCYSSHSKLVRVTAWCLRFVNNVRVQKGNSYFLTAQEIVDASNLWLKYTQKKYFDDILNALAGGKGHSMISQLGLYIDSNNIIRCAGRFPVSQFHPKLLPKDSQYTKLCIIRDHRRLFHVGVAHTLAEVRKEHWILQGRAAVRKIIRQCLICLHWEGGPFKTPKFAKIPDYVLSDNFPPFAYTGIDYLGPLLVKDEKRGTKNWICLFTCLNVRAIHLEVIDDMTTDSFLLCLRRFVSRRGTPSLIISDNAPNFKLGNSVINRIWKHVVRDVDIQSYVANEGIQWKFITDMAPWKGGFYERLVGLTKRSLRKALGRSKASNQELVTIISECEAIINSRPLTYVDADINSGHSLTPGHFLSLNQKTGYPNIEIRDSNTIDLGTKLIKMWKTGQDQLSNFWNIWLTEYLQVLRERKTYQLKPIKGEVRRKPNVGETVIIKEEYQPRGKWKLATVQRLIESDVDKKHRAAQLLLPSGLLIKRPFKLIFPLEMNNDDKDEEGKNNASEGV